MSKVIKNLEISIQHKLRNIAKSKGEDTEAIIYRYVAERFLYRLSISQYQSKFFLKGAFLFTIWEDNPHRPTRDIDFLGNIKEQIGVLEDILKNVCSIKCEEDALTFNTESIKGESIRKDQAYGGIRFQILSKLGKTKVILKIDIGFGDIITPEPILEEIPSLLGMKRPRIQAYPIYTVLAEKLQAMLVLDINNSRMKDFYDLWFLTNKFDIDIFKLKQAIQNTFSRRKTKLPTQAPTALTEEFSLNSEKNIQWKAFLRKNELDTDLDLKGIVSSLNHFFMPVFLDMHKS